MTRGETSSVELARPLSMAFGSAKLAIIVTQRLDSSRCGRALMSRCCTGGARPNLPRLGYLAHTAMPRTRQICLSTRLEHFRGAHSRFADAETIVFLGSGARRGRGF